MAPLGFDPGVAPSLDEMPRGTVSPTPPRESGTDHCRPHPFLDPCRIHRLVRTLGACPCAEPAIGGNMCMCRDRVLRSRVFARAHAQRRVFYCFDKRWGLARRDLVRFPFCWHWSSAISRLPMTLDMAPHGIPRARGGTPRNTAPLRDGSGFSLLVLAPLPPVSHAPAFSACWQRPHPAPPPPSPPPPAGRGSH